MKINEPKLETEQKQSRRLSLQTKLSMLVFGLFLVVTGLFYWYYTSTTAQLQQAKQLEAFAKSLADEKNKCSQTISQGKGEFGEYEYCTRLLNVFKDN